MAGTGSGLVSNSAAPSGRRGRNCGPLCPQGRNPLSSGSSAHGVFATRRQPETAGRSKFTASCSKLSTTPGPFLSGPAPFACPRVYPSPGPYSRPSSNTESQIPHTTPSALVTLSLNLYPHTQDYNQLPDFLSHTPSISAMAFSSNSSHLTDLLGFSSLHPSSLFSLTPNPNLSSVCLPYPCPIALTKKIRPMETSRTITARRITTTMAHAGNELFSPFAPSAWRPPGELWLLCCW